MRRNDPITTTAAVCIALLALTFFTGPWNATRAAADAERNARDVSRRVERDEGEEEEEAHEEGDDHESSEWEREEHHMHRRHRHLEVQMAELETSFGRMEMVSKIAHVADDELMTATFAVVHVTDFMEPSEAAELLEEILSSATRPDLRRMIRIKLAEIYAHDEKPNMVKEQLRILIAGE